jgi:hypothetical protein
VYLNTCEKPCGGILIATSKPLFVLLNDTAGGYNIDVSQLADVRGINHAGARPERF